MGLSENYNDFRTSNSNFEISLRQYNNDMALPEYIKKHYPMVPLSQIKSIYSFSEFFSRLYGGRPFVPDNTLKQVSIDIAYNNGIKFYIPLTNHVFTQEAYKDTWPLLEKNERTGNAIICYSDDLARAIKVDFPQYKIIASVIKNISTITKINKALEIYDSVVLPPQINDNDELLNSLEDKKRFILFANNRCRLECTNWICYKAISQGIRDARIPLESGTAHAIKGEKCSRRPPPTQVIFDIKKFEDMGFNNFKMIPPLLYRQPMAMNPCKKIVVPKFDRPIFIVSNPRSGSTLLYETLKSSGNIWSINAESSRIMRTIEPLRPRNHNFNTHALTESDLTNDIASRLKTSFAELSMNCFGERFCNHSASIRFLEKTPLNSMRIPFFKALFPDALFIFLYREPRGNMSSMLDAWRSEQFMGFRNLEGMSKWCFHLFEGWRAVKDEPLPIVVMHQWIIAIESILNSLENISPNDWEVISYERLSTSPHKEIKRLCKFIDVPMDEHLVRVTGSRAKHSRYTLTPPSPDKWLKNKHDINPLLPRLQATIKRVERCFKDKGVRL